MQDPLPDEDPEEFDRQHESLRDEWKTDGATEEEAVLSLAYACRAVRRMERFIEEEIALATVSPLHNEVNVMLDLTEILENTKREIVARQVLGELPEAVRQFLNRTYPRGNFEKPQEWIAALVSAMPTLLEIHSTAATREQAQRGHGALRISDSDPSLTRAQGAAWQLVYAPGGRQGAGLVLDRPAGMRSPKTRVCLLRGGGRKSHCKVGLVTLLRPGPLRPHDR